MASTPCGMTFEHDKHTYQTECFTIEMCDGKPIIGKEVSTAEAQHYSPREVKAD